MNPSQPRARLSDSLPLPWRTLLEEETCQPYFKQIVAFLEKEMQENIVFPPAEFIFNAFRLTPPDKVKAVILGQDPYHDHGQAHGLAFSVPPGTPPPPSLKNILKELNSDLGIPFPSHGCLDHWASRGVLLLNCVLTVRAHQPNSHSNKGWELFTDAVIRKINSSMHNIVFILWGRHAHDKSRHVDTSRNHIIAAPHPSPLSSHRGFFGSRPFSSTNNILKNHSVTPIDWSFPEHHIQPEFNFQDDSS